MKERVKNGRQYLVEMDDGSVIEQHSHFMFSPYTRSRCKIFKKGDFVLAAFDDLEYIYKPAYIVTVADNHLDVEFYDGKR